VCVCLWCVWCVCVCGVCVCVVCVYVCGERRSVDSMHPKQCYLGMYYIASFGVQLIGF